MPSSGRLSLRTFEDGALVVAFEGRWRLGEVKVPDANVLGAVDAPPPPRIGFDTTALEAWDSELVAFVTRLCAVARARGVPVDDGGLPAGVRRLLALAAANPVRTPSPHAPPRAILIRIGTSGMLGGRVLLDVVAFVGEVALALVQLVRGRARIRARDVFLQLQLAGAQALPIVSLVCFLVGLILAFIAAVQLAELGATIYTADLVGISMVRELGAMMAAIVMAGRTGAAYAAELGSMQASQEIDALKVIGISPVEHLVLPRFLALTLMLPLLCIYADILGILGGAVVGIGLLHIPVRVYHQETIAALELRDLFGGLLKASVYGGLVALAGCFEGLRSGSSAAAVGRAVTSAVVDGIVLIIVACGMFAVAFYILGW